jgi:hypothetical protein
LAYRPGVLAFRFFFQPRLLPGNERLQVTWLTTEKYSVPERNPYYCPLFFFFYYAHHPVLVGLLQLISFKLHQYKFAVTVNRYTHTIWTGNKQ